MMTRNQIMAKVLFSNRLVSEAQVQAYWQKIDSAHDLGQLLVEAGVLDSQTYQAVAKYVSDLEVKLSAAEKAKSEKPKSAFERPAAHAEPAKENLAQKESAPAPKKEPEPVKEAPAVALEGNNPYGQSTVTSVQIEKVEGLEQTSMASVTVAATAPETKADEAETLPDRFEIESGEGAVSVPDQLSAESSLVQILAYARKRGASDVYLSESSPAYMRAFGKMVLMAEDLFGTSALSRLLSEAKHGFADGYEPVVGTDFSKSFALAGAGRNRLTVTWNETVPSLSIRLIASDAIPLSELALPPFCADFLNLSRGLVLIAGPSESGRSMTLGTLGEAILQSRPILATSIEKPIERLLAGGAGLIVQKEIGLHSLSGKSAIEDAVLAGSHLILFDHLDSAEELWALLKASSAGALVLAVATGNDVRGLLSRLLLENEAESGLASALADELKGVIVQHLIPAPKEGYAVAVEALKVNSSVANLIRRQDLNSIPSMIASAKNLGQSLDDSLEALVKEGEIRGEDAWSRSLNRRRFAAYRPTHSRRS